MTPSKAADRDPGDVGQVQRAQDGLVWVSGLQAAFSGEQVTFPGGSGLIRALLRDRVLVEVLFEERTPRPGVEVYRSGVAPWLPTGPGLAGRVVSALGEPLDGEGPLAGPLAPRPLDPPIRQTGPQVGPTAPLWTGHPAVDLLYPLGHGMSALIVGEPGSGRTRLATLAMVAQARERAAGGCGAHCVYVAVGRTTREVASLRQRLAEAGALAGVTLVLAGPAASPLLRCLAPAAGLALAEAVQARGQRAVVIVDDLSQVAEAWASRMSALGQIPNLEGLETSVGDATRALIARVGQRPASRGGGSLSLLLIADRSPLERDRWLVRDLEDSVNLIIPMAREALGGRPGPVPGPHAHLGRLLRRWQPRAMRWAIPAKYGLMSDDEWRSQGGYLLFGQDDPVTGTWVKAGARTAMLFSRPEREPVSLALLLARVVLASDLALFGLPSERLDRILDALTAHLLEHEPELMCSFPLTGRDHRREEMDRLRAAVKRFVAP